MRRSGRWANHLGVAAPGARSSRDATAALWDWQSGAKLTAVSDRAGRAAARRRRLTRRLPCIPGPSNCLPPRRIMSSQDLGGRRSRAEAGVEASARPGHGGMPSAIRPRRLRSPCLGRCAFAPPPVMHLAAARPERGRPSRAGVDRRGRADGLSHRRRNQTRRSHRTCASFWQGSCGAVATARRRRAACRKSIAMKR